MPVVKHTFAPLIDQAYAILDEAFKNSDISHVVALFSGGHDSVVSTDITMEWAKARGIHAFVMSIDTRTGLPENEAYVRALVAHMQWPWQYYHTPVRYEALALERGFPGSPMHQKMFDRLKGRCVDQLLRDYAQYIELAPTRLKSGDWGKPKRIRRPILLTTGVRKNESAIRMGYKDPTQVRGSAVWSNPIFWWTATQAADYMEWRGIPRSPVVDKIHRSGDCGCGANAHPGEMKELELWYSQDIKWLKELERRVIEKGFVWGWNEAPPNWWGNVKSGQEFLSPDMMMLCVGCTARGDGSACPVDLDMGKMRDLMAHEGEYRLPQHINEIPEFRARILAGTAMANLAGYSVEKRAARLLAGSAITQDYTYWRTLYQGSVWQSPRQDYIIRLREDGYDDIYGETLLADPEQLPIEAYNEPRELPPLARLHFPKETWWPRVQALDWSVPRQLVAQLMEQVDQMTDDYWATSNKNWHDRWMDTIDYRDTTTHFAVQDYLKELPYATSYHG